jgi:hypothetical protein
VGRVTDTLLWGRRKGSVMLEGSQASLVCPSDKTGVETKALECLEVVA